MRMVDVERAMGAPGTRALCAPRSLCDFALLLMLPPLCDYLTGLHHSMERDYLSRRHDCDVCALRRRKRGAWLNNHRYR